MLPASAFAAVNADDPHAEDMVQDTKAKVVTMAVQGVADERARLIENQITGLVLHLDGQELYSSQLVGGFNASNLLAVYVVSKLLGTDKINALTQMSLLKPPAGRFERCLHATASPPLSTTHTPPTPWTTCSKPLPTCAPEENRSSPWWGAAATATRPSAPPWPAAPTRLRPRHPDQRQPTKRGPRRHSEGHGTRFGPHRKAQMPEHRGPSRSDSNGCRLAEPGDIVLVAGKGHETYQEIQGERHPFDDRLELKEAFAPTT